MNERLTQPQPPEPQGEMEGHGGGWKHWWWMILCCVPMIAIIVLSIVGVIGSR